MRKFKILLSVIIINICGYTFYQVISSNIINKKIEYQIQNANYKNESIDTIDNEYNNNNDYSNNNDINLDKSINNNKSNNDFAVLIKSPTYNALVSLDENSNEFKVTLLDDISQSTQNNASHYINLSKDNIDYLIKNKESLITEFKQGGILDKYNLVSTMLKSYDTNIDIDDLIQIAFKFIN